MGNKFKTFFLIAGLLFYGCGTGENYPEGGYTATGGGGGTVTGGSGVSVSSSPTSISTYGLATITANVNDSSGNPVADGTTVDFALSDSNLGVLSSATATTTNGTATVNVTAKNVAGLLKVTATSGALSGSVSISVTASAVAAISLQAAPSSVTVGGQSTITAYVYDGTGNKVADMTSVSFSLSDPTIGSLSSGNVLTFNGTATVTFTATGSSGGTVTVNASSESAKGSIDIAVTGGLAGGAITLAASPNSILTGATSTVTATLKDSSGSPVQGATVSFTLNNTYATLSSPTAVTDASGVATVTLTAGSLAGTVSVSGSASGLSGNVAVTINEPVVGGGSLTVNTGSSAIFSNKTTLVTATLLDGGGSAVLGGTINFSLDNSSVATLSSTSATTDASGEAVVTLTAGTTPTSVTVTAKESLLYNVQDTATVTLEAPLPASVSVATNPSTITVLGTATVTATVKDSDGNPVLDGTQVTFSLSHDLYGSLSSQVTSTAGGNGTATTTFLASNSPGTVTITAKAGTVSSTTPLTVIPASTGSIQFISAEPQIIAIKGSGGTGSSVVTFKVLDINGNPVAEGTPVSFTLKGPGGGEYIGQEDATPTTAIGATVTGNAVVILNSGTIAGPVTITASTNINSGTPTALTADIDETVTTVPVVSTAGFPATGRIRVDNELIDYTGLTGTSFTGCTRGAMSTLAQGHLTDANVYNQAAISSSATQISIGGGAPSAAHYTLAIETGRINLPGFSYVNEQSHDSAFLADRFGNYNVLPGQAVSFYTEGGSIDTQGLTDDTGETVVIFRTQDPMPEDVARARAGDALSNKYFGGANEPYYVFGGYTTNPRDGWVTVLSTSQGEEKFLDENVDGLFTRSYSTGICPFGAVCECDGGVTNGYTGYVSGGSACAVGKRSEGFVDLGEPYYDVNDDKTRDDGTVVGKPFELFIDADESGSYDLPNGMWDGPDCQSPTCEKNKMIWKDIRHVFSGGDPLLYPYPDANNCYNLVMDAHSCYAGYNTTGPILPAGITAADATIVFNNSSTIIAGETALFPPSGLIRIDNELITYTGKTDTEFTGCTRGVYGTAAAAHSMFATIYGQNLNPYFAYSPASIARGSSGSFTVIFGDLNLNRLQGGTTISVVASPGTVTPSTIPGVLDGLSTGPSMRSFSVEIAPDEKKTQTTITINITTPKGLIATAMLVVPII